MLRARKDIDYAQHLEPEDLKYLGETITLSQWYPMGVFERMGNVILKLVGGGNIEMVRLWGRFSIKPLVKEFPSLVHRDDPMETLARFMVLRKTFFDYDVFAFDALEPSRAEVRIAYQMGDEAERAASFQAMGFFEAVLQAAGATDVQASFKSSSWENDPDTVLSLSWS
jgi:hypothetical protein